MPKATNATFLTASQKEACDETATQCAAAIEEERLAQQDQPAGESTKRPTTVDRTLKNMRDADAYKAQKESLETGIASQEAEISLLRKSGYTKGQLVEYDDKLNRYRRELHDLKQPMP